MSEKSEDNEPDGMVALAIGVAEQRWPHTMDAQVWADEWLKQLEKTPWMASNRESMIGWFANAIMAGYDRGCFDAQKAGRRKV
jgi:hypothetical protein